MCWKVNPALASSADLWGASKTYFAFYRLFPWCTEVPIANSAAAQLQKMAQPGYNPVAACPSIPRLKSSGFTLTSQNGAFSCSDMRAQRPRLNLPKLPISFESTGATEAGSGIHTPSAKAPRQFRGGKARNSYSPAAFLRQFLRRNVRLKNKQTATSNDCTSSMSASLSRRTLHSPVCSHEPEHQGHAALPAPTRQHSLRLARAGPACTNGPFPKASSRDGGAEH